jgi:hypothetical protein
MPAPAGLAVEAVSRRRNHRAADRRPCVTSRFGRPAGCPTYGVSKWPARRVRPPVCVRPEVEWSWAIRTPTLRLPRSPATARRPKRGPGSMASRHTLSWTGPVVLMDSPSGTTYAALAIVRVLPRQPSAWSQRTDEGRHAGEQGTDDGLGGEVVGGGAEMGVGGGEVGEHLGRGALPVESTDALAGVQGRGGHVGRTDCGGESFVGRVVGLQ